MYQIRQLELSDTACFQRLRMAALHDTPSAFTTSLHAEQALSSAQWHARIRGTSLSGIWGAWHADGTLVASAGLMHQAVDKVEHKATLYAVYVAPSARGAGLSRQLVESMIEHARNHTPLQQLLLSVTAGNAPAHQLYLSLGFNEYGREPCAIRTQEGWHDQILMHLPLRTR